MINNNTTINDIDEFIKYTKDKTFKPKNYEHYFTENLF
jgi:hypothetical protein